MYYNFTKAIQKIFNFINKPMSNTDNIILYYNPNGENFTIGNYKKAIKDKNIDVLADFVYNRLYSRYIKPFEFSCEEYKKHYKNGFAMMASFCLLIETLQSFKEGLGDSNGKSKQLFIIFFSEQKELFGEFEGEDFYKNIRCGILHQGETAGGWKLNRKENKKVNSTNFKILSESKTIQVNNFMNAIKKVLEDYRHELKNKSWDDDLWKKFRCKMDFIIKNCEDTEEDNSNFNLGAELGRLKSKKFNHYCQFKNEVIFNTKLSNLSKSKIKKINNELDKNQNLINKNTIIDEILKIIK